VRGSLARVLFGKKVKATEQPIDASTAAGKCFLDMLGAFAEFETNLKRSLGATYRCGAGSCDCSKIGREGFGAVGSVRQAQGRHQRVRWPVLPASGTRCGKEVRWLSRGQGSSGQSLADGRPPMCYPPGWTPS
jgi:hypothetical protein